MVYAGRDWETLTPRRLYTAIYAAMAEEAGGRVAIEKVLEDWAIQQDMLDVADNGDTNWADADRLALSLLADM